MKILFSSDVTKYLENLKKKNPKLLNKIHKKLSLFKENPRHRSLRTHKLEGNLSGSWSISVEGNIRILYYLKKDVVVFFVIGTHDEVYRK